MHAQLIPLDGGPSITLTKAVTLVGRKREVCDVVLDRNSISKLHCVIAKTDGLLFIRDLGSTNGTKVNGQRVTRGALLPGDELSFASARFRVHLGPDRPEEANLDDRTAALTSVPHFSGIPDDDSRFDPADRIDDMNSESDVRLISDDSVV